MTPLEKFAIFNAASRTMREWYGDQLAQQGACLYWNQVAMRELAMRGYKPILQAGDMHWRMVDPLVDDGQQATHFGYEFDLSQPFSQEAIAKGLLPEVHIWCALREQQAIVDFSTAYLPQVARERHGFEWTAAKPPCFVFGRIPEAAVYVPKVEAIRYVWGFIAEKMVGPEDREKILAAVGV